MTGWEIVPMTGFRISHPYIARAPNCPKERHPTRDCGCKVFRTTAEAATYITTQKEATLADITVDDGSQPRDPSLSSD
jgi:hypothetical protein